MKLTKQTLYKLIKEAIEDQHEKDVDPNYARLFDETKPLALYHHSGKEDHMFILYHLTDNPQHPYYVVSYLSMELLASAKDTAKCIPYTFQVQGVYTERAAQRRGFSKVLYNIAFYIANKYKFEKKDGSVEGYGLTSDQFSGTTDVASTAAWSKYEKSGEYIKRQTDAGNDSFDYVDDPNYPLTPDDPDDDCRSFSDAATSRSFQKQNPSEASQIYLELSGRHGQNANNNPLSRQEFQIELEKVAVDRFNYYYGVQLWSKK